MAEGEIPTKSQLNKCGKLLARHQRGDAVAQNASDAQLEHAKDQVRAFRAAHSTPMLKTRIGMTSFIRTSTGADPVVSQRLKRVPRIIRKLSRKQGSNLASLQDIAGVRAVLETPRQVEQVLAHMHRRWGSRIDHVDDRVASPHEIGYRAIHVIVVRDGLNVEIQLRTRQQQSWADLVEATDAFHALNLKDGYGPPVLMEYFSTLGEFYYRHEYGEPITMDLIDKLMQAQDAAVDANYFAAATREG